MDIFLGGRGANFSFFVGQGRYRLVVPGTGLCEKRGEGKLLLKRGQGNFSHGVSGDGDTVQVLIPFKGYPDYLAYRLTPNLTLCTARWKPNSRPLQYVSAWEC